MVHLTLAGLSQDKSRLVLVSDAGVEFTLDVDARLRAALRGDTDRLGQLEITMESTLRPRDIQSRIRAGATPDDVARAGQTTVDKIMPFVAPVLAERAHVAERAQSSSVRRRPDGSGGGARTLGEAVSAHLSRHRSTGEEVEWDAWRRDDGRWTLQATFATSERSGTGTFSYDVRGSYVVADDDAARWLIGEETAPPAAARDDLQQARRRRAGRATMPDAVLDLELDSPDHDLGDGPLGSDAIALVAEPRDREPTVDLSEVADAVRRGEGAPASPERPAPGRTERPEQTPDQLPETAPTAAEGVVAETVTRATDEQASPASDPSSDRSSQDPGDQPTDEPVAPAPPPQKRSGRKRRASVPSWDEIMFGGGGD
ncbi:septation protein SepH [Nocardioides zeae]|uniref:Septation protein SepH n=1 Tax=Nocardioides imazamoxiresistens TaxID=3231893 RepID=A0ABU3PZC8_9ACTN|nr:septation protein SepH [Nocardioides zeae]MDT9594595.1 septation protein SepH [Nocardioides zeae]